MTRSSERLFSQANLLWAWIADGKRNKLSLRLQIMGQERRRCCRSSATWCIVRPAIDEVHTGCPMSRCASFLLPTSTKKCTMTYGTHGNYGMESIITRGFFFLLNFIGTIRGIKSLITHSLRPALALMKAFNRTQHLANSTFCDFNSLYLFINKVAAVNEVFEIDPHN